MASEWVIISTVYTDCYIDDEYDDCDNDDDDGDGGSGSGLCLTTLYLN